MRGDTTAVCVIALNDDGKVLVLQPPPRPYNTKKLQGFSLPGGSVFPGEEPVLAAARELFEETGLLPIDSMRCVYLAVDADHHIVACFLTRCEGTPISGREGTVTWEDPGVLLRSTNTYSQYNRAALKAAGFKEAV